jgi:predicted RNA-binding protein
MAPAWEDTYDEAQRRTEDTRRKMFIDAIREKIPAVDPELAFLTPTELIDAMTQNEVITSFHERLSEYEAEEKEIGILFPDADRKPWTKGKTSALIYRNLYTSIKNLKLEEKVGVFTISPLLGVVPLEWYEDMPMYDSSGAQSFMVRRRGLTWNVEDFKEVIKRSGALLSDFLSRNHERCGKWHVIYREPSVHQRIFQSAMDERPFSVWPHSTKKSLADSYLQMRAILKEISEG